MSSSTTTASRTWTPRRPRACRPLVDGFKTGEIPKEAITYKEEEGRRAFQDGNADLPPPVAATCTPLANKTDGSSKVAGKFDVAPLPGISGPGVSTLGGHNFAISAFAKNKATALDFIKFFSSEETCRVEPAGHLAGADLWPPCTTTPG